MTINAINNENNYPDSIKSYLLERARQSVFNSPIVKTAFVASTVLVTGIAAAYFVKKTKEAIRVAIDRPLQTACLTAAVFATGTVIVYHPVVSMITFVGISYILLNRNLYTKIHDTHQIFLTFFDSPFKVIGNLAGARNNSKNDVSLNDNLSLLGITKAIEQLNLEDLKLGSPQSLEDDVISTDTLLPLVTTEEVQQLNLKDTKLESTESLDDDKSSNEDQSLLGIAKTIKQFNLEDLKLGSRDPLESATGSTKPFTFPTPINNIYPYSNPSGVWPTKPFKVIKTVKNPTPNGGLLPKSYGNLLKLVRIIPK